MKHTILRLSCFYLLFFSIALRMAAAQELQPASALSTAAIAGATIAEWRGAVHLTLPGQPVSNPLRGEQLPAGTILDTGSGKLILHLKDGSEVLIRSHTKLQIQQPSFADPSYFRLLLGRIRALVNKRTGGAAPFELGTPSAVIAVRGTQFEVEVNQRGVTEVDVIDGLVEVSGRRAASESVLVGPGFSTRVGLDSGPEQPEPTNEIRPEVERPNHGETETSQKSEIEVEFGRTNDQIDTQAENLNDPMNLDNGNEKGFPAGQDQPDQNAPEKPSPDSAAS